MASPEFKCQNIFVAFVLVYFLLDIYIAAIIYISKIKIYGRKKKTEEVNELILHTYFAFFEVFLINEKLCSFGGFGRSNIASVGFRMTFFGFSYPF